MTIATTVAERGARPVRANGIDIAYVEAGEGPPLVLLHGGLVSTGPLWADQPVAYVSHMATLAKHFRVIAPDTRGSGATVHGDGSASFSVLADDVVALIDALDLDRPMLAGFSEGAMTATVVAIREPDAVRAVVNDAGYDTFDPQAPAFEMGRMMFGGSPDATEADPDAAERAFHGDPQMASVFERMRADYDSAQGEGHWRKYLHLFFDRITRFPGYTFDDFRNITAPTLILTGDRDHFCSVEDAAIAYRNLTAGELAILPNTGHEITSAAIDTTVDFLLRHATN
jgi:pimeloyl-ACP methyl ester carboxylesterase